MRFTMSKELLFNAITKCGVLYRRRKGGEDKDGIVVVRFFWMNEIDGMEIDLFMDGNFLIRLFK